MGCTSSSTSEQLGINPEIDDYITVPKGLDSNKELRVTINKKVLILFL